MTHGTIARNCLPPPTQTQGLQQLLPEGTCDSHLHVFGPSALYPLHPGRSYTPYVSSLADYQTIMAALGIERAVLIQSSVYGTDNSALLHALQAGGNTFRGVVVPPPDIHDNELLALHEAGVRGIRLNLANPQILSMDDAIQLSGRVATLGWHLQLQVQFSSDPGSSNNTVALLGKLADQLQLPLVLDHMGRIDPRMKFTELISFFKNSNSWVKLSAPYRSSLLPFPHQDLTPIVEALFAACADRLLWGTDWPHTEHIKDSPQAASLAELLQSWVPDAQALQQVCVDNPARLYDFP